jgi:phosphoglycolate phosphatase-like HAD superfamily hydrolase
MLEQSAFIKELVARGFQPHKPRTHTWKVALVAKNASGQTLFVMFSNVGVDFKIYLDEMTLDFDERGLLYTGGGIMKRFRYDAFQPADDLHDFTRDVIDQFLDAEYGSLDDTFDPGPRSQPVRSCIKLCLFDLDGILLDTSDLGQWRSDYYLEGATDIPGFTVSDTDEEKLLAQFDRHPARYVYTLQNLIAIRRHCPGTKFGIVSRSPRHYTRTLLGHAYPNFRWDQIIAQEDLNTPSDLGSGIELAMQRSGIDTPAQVTYVGNTEAHLRAAFDIGCWAALERSAFPPFLQNSHYRTLELGWDGVLRNHFDVTRFVNLPSGYLPELDFVSAHGVESDKPRRLKVHYLDPQPVSTATHLPVVALGRYFVSGLKNRAAWHSLTTEMLEFKRTALFPRTWMLVLMTAVRGIASLHKSPLIITVMPAKPGKLPRLELLLAALSADLGHYHGCEYRTDVLAFAQGATSSHFANLGKAQRLELARQYLGVSKLERVHGRDIVVIDDIVTSGASLVTARNRLLEAGAATVTCLALAKATTHRKQDYNYE